SLFLNFLDQVDWTTVLDVTESEDLKRAEASASGVKAALVSLRDQAQRITDLLVDTPSQTLKDQLLKTEAKIQAQQAELEVAEHNAGQLRAKHSDLLDRETVYSQLALSTDLKTRARLREEIRRKVTKISLKFHIQLPLPGFEDSMAAMIEFI